MNGLIYQIHHAKGFHQGHELMFIECDFADMVSLIATPTCVIGRNERWGWARVEAANFPTGG